MMALFTPQTAKWKCSGTPWLALFCVSLALRLLYLGRRDLTLDETWSFFLVKDYSLRQILSPLTEILYNDVHPPFFYAICELWHAGGYDVLQRLSGDPEFAFRFPFAVISAAVAPVLFSIGRQIHGTQLGWTLGCLHVINSYSIQMVHQTRMYPLIELLAAAGVLFWVALREKTDSGAIWLMAACSSLMMLTQYLCAFYLIVLWAMIGFVCRRRPLRVLTALLVSALGFAWWSPALLHQLQVEAAAAGATGSTGLIIPYTVYQFLLGDRSLIYGARILSGLNGWTVSVFGIAALGTGCMAWVGRYHRPRVADIGILGFASIVLLWVGTFAVPRVFYATFYAIFALPALLVAIAAILSAGQHRLRRIGYGLLILVVAANATTLVAFYRNTLYPFEPWKQACDELRSRQIERIAVYAPHMQLLVRLYGDDLKVEPLPYVCGEWSPPLPAHETEVPLALVISHDRGQGGCYSKRFRSVFGPVRERISLHGIEIAIFGAPL